ncbi:MAG: isocitrate lyase/phosphoenolpyruvate mutase family protein [Proteobacteria bacterium]|nr:isocitrate lyase/phosphoenolpyruvate mutase family protein [Pseudomonadota bacterium]
MTETRAQKVEAFRALHAAPGAFVLPNPWDRGSARILASMGFQALATTSAGFAFSIGVVDGVPGRAAVLANAADIVAETSLPVNADLENCFADAPDAAAETIRLAAETGLAGGSIEDASGNPGAPIYDFSLAVERVAAAAEAARAVPGGFVLTARAENFLHGRPDLDDTIRRLQAFEKAGAEVLYAPGLPDMAAIRAVCSSVSRPVNVLANPRIPGLSVAAMAEAGAKRISLGGTLTRAAFGALLRAGRELLDTGTFRFAADAMPGAEIAAVMRKDAGG